MGKKFNEFLKQINEYYDDDFDYLSYDSDESVDAEIYLDLKEAINTVTENPNIASKLFKYFADVCAKGNYKYVHIDKNFLIIKDDFPYNVMAHIEKHGYVDEPVYESFLKVFKALFLNNKHVYIGKTGIQNGNLDSINNSRVRKGKFNVYPYIEEIYDLIADNTIELDCYPTRDLKAIAREAHDEDIDMEMTYRDLYYFR